MIESRGTSRENRDAPIPLTAIGLVGISTLLFEILLTRIFSVTMWYHFAFIAISLALFGIAASGALVTLSAPFSQPERALKLMAISSACFGLAIPISFVIDLNIPFIPFDIAGSRMAAFALFLMKFLVLSVPFFFSGLTLATAFTNAPARVNRVYFADLVGGGIGCGLVVPMLTVLSGPSAIISVAALPFLAAALFFRRAGLRRGTVLSLVGLSGIVVLVGLNEKLEIFAVTHVKSYAQDRGQEPERPKVYERWHPTSRVAVHPESVSGSPQPWFYAGPVPGGFPPVLEITNDGGARTFIYPKLTQEEYAGLFRADVSDIVYSLTSSPDVLVIGVGGGKDVLAALSLGAATVTGVELNPLMIEVVQDAFADFSGRPYDDPRVRVVIDEGRNFVASRETSYDVIKIAATDTWVASARGAYSLTENYLYTREAIRDFINHLTPGGFLSISRWYPQETLRLAALVSESLRALGHADPESRILMARNAATLTCIVKNGVISSDERSRFAVAAEQAGLVLVHVPGQGTIPSNELDAYHGRLVETPHLASVTPRELSRAHVGRRTDLRPRAARDIPEACGSPDPKANLGRRELVLPRHRFGLSVDRNSAHAAIHPVSGSSRLRSYGRALFAAGGQRVGESVQRSPDAERATAWWVRGCGRCGNGPFDDALSANPLRNSDWPPDRGPDRPQRGGHLPCGLLAGLSLPGRPSGGSRDRKQFSPLGLGGERGGFGRRARSGHADLDETGLLSRAVHGSGRLHSGHGTLADLRKTELIAEPTVFEHRRQPGQQDAGFSGELKRCRSPGPALPLPHTRVIGRELLVTAWGVA